MWSNSESCSIKIPVTSCHPEFNSGSLEIADQVRNDKWRRPGTTRMKHVEQLSELLYQKNTLIFIQIFLTFQQQQEQ